MPNRIVSLIASGTEIVSALGYGNELVGRSHECDFPPFVERLPACSEPRIDVHASSREIDDQVRGAVTEALSVYRVLVGRLDELAPTHIITQSQCEVCAVSLSDVERAVCEMVGSKPIIVSLEPMDLEDVWNDIVKTAAALGDRSRGERLVVDLKGRLDDVSQAVASLSERPTVACLEWLEPLMSAGNWVPELVELAGGRQVLGTAGKHSPSVSWDQLCAADPEVIAVMPCGFDILRTTQELDLLTRSPHWSRLQAVRNNRVFITDGNQYFNRPGPRLVESAEILAEILLLERCNPAQLRHHGAGWRRLDEILSS